MRIISEKEKDEVCTWWNNYQQKKQTTSLPELEKSTELDQIITETNQWWKNRTEGDLKRQETRSIKVEHSIEMEGKCET